MRRCSVVLAVFLALTSLAAGQRIAIITPNNSPLEERYADALSDNLALEAKVIDRSLAESVFKAKNSSAPFNLAITDAKDLAAGIGCEYVIILRAETVRRASFSKPDYYQSFAVIYLVSGRTGRLIDWRLSTFENSKADDATTLLIGSIPETAKDLLQKTKRSSETERSEPSPKPMEEVPDENSPLSKDLRPPVPYKRIKPEYTKLASFYSVQATVETLADISADGEVTRIEIVRWAGFGLDESVADTVRKMNWRPAMRNGNPLPMRVLLRYNFTKISDDQ